MTELENRLQHELREMAERITYSDLRPLRAPRRDSAAPRPGSAATRRRPRWLAPAAAAVAVACVAGAFSLAGYLMPAGLSPVGQQYRCGSVPPGQRAATAGRPSALGLLAASANLCDRIELRATGAPVGATINGILIVINRGDRPISLNGSCRPWYSVVPTRRSQMEDRIAATDSCGCQPQYAAVISSGRFPADSMIAFAYPCVIKPLIMRVGVTRLPFKIETVYPGCRMPGGQSAPSVPACLHGDVLPPLPAGRYTAVLVGDGTLPLPAPAGVPVILREPSAG